MSVGKLIFCSSVFFFNLPLPILQEVNLSVCQGEHAPCTEIAEEERHCAHHSSGHGAGRVFNHNTGKRDMVLPSVRITLKVFLFL